MLPDGAGNGLDSGRYGSYAMELLINELMKRGATRSTLEAKVFGGGQVIAGMNTMNVGQRNTEFVLDYLKTERIPVVSKDVMDVYPRKVCFLPHCGKAMVKRLLADQRRGAGRQDRAAAQKPVPPPAPAGGLGGPVLTGDTRSDEHGQDARWWWSTIRPWCAACCRRSSTASRTWNAWARRPTRSSPAR